MYNTNNRRRTFSRICWSLSLLCLILTMTSCAGLPEWVAEAGQILPVLLPILSGVLALAASLSGKTIPPSTVALINEIVAKAETGLTTLEALVKEYQSVPTPSIMTEIEAGAAAVVAELQPLLALADVTDPETQAKITVIVQMVLSELQGLLAAFPILAQYRAVYEGDDPGKEATLAKLAATLHSVSPAPLSPKELKHAYNFTIKAKTNNPVVDAALAKLHTI